MRKNLLHYWYKELSYEIREIIEYAKLVEKHGTKLILENIGDPIAKWEQFPKWMKEIIIQALEDDTVFWYSPSRGLESAREFLASKNTKLQKDDIIFFNGLGEAINKIYGYLAMTAKVLWPNPAYPTHASAEATNSGSEHLTYSLDPKNDWNPDLEEIENKVKYNPNITAILVINPDNPTGATFKRHILEGIIDIARRYDMFVIFDEIYEQLIFDRHEKVILADIIGEVPGISMKGMSKDVPWPGGRCGWIEVYNKSKDQNFSDYIDSVYASKMLEVCSTTLPQYVLPKIYSDARFTPYIQDRIEKYKKRAKQMNDVLWDISCICYVPPKWAFYASIVFDMSYIQTLQKINIQNPELKDAFDNILSKKTNFDVAFCYSLLTLTGVCVVPLSGFNSNFEGFRMTLLEEDDEVFLQSLHTIGNFIQTYIL